MADSFGQAQVKVRLPGELIWADGFDSYSSFELAAGYSLSSSYSRVPGSGGGLHFTTSDNNTSYATKMFTNNYDEAIVHFAFKLSGINSSGLPIFLVSFMSSSNTEVGGYAVMADGSLGYYIRPNSDAGTAVAVSSPGLITGGVWYLVESKIKISNTVGYVEIRLNGETIVNASNVDTAYVLEYFNGIEFNSADAGSAITQDFDDFYILDNTYNTVDFLGDKRVLDILPSAEGNHSDWTPSTGTNNAALIDDGTTINDSDYVSTTTIDAVDTYTFTDLPANVSSIGSLMYVIRASKNDAGFRTIRAVQRQGGVDYERDQSDTSLSSGFDDYTYVEMINPATGLAWTVTDINSNAEFGFKLES